MPGRDGTGPDGLGPMTGRGLGNNALCAGRGRRQLRRRAFCRFTQQEIDLTPEEKIEMLKREKAVIEKEIKALEEEKEHG